MKTKLTTLALALAFFASSVSFAEEGPSAKPETKEVKVTEESKPEAGKKQEKKNQRHKREKRNHGGHKKDGAQPTTLEIKPAVEGAVDAKPRD